MKIKRMVIISLISFVLLFSAPQLTSISSVKASNTSFSCSGTVTDGVNPIYNAKVELYADESIVPGSILPKASTPTLKQTVYTDSLGRYSVSCFSSASVYIVEASKSGYQGDQKFFGMGTVTWNPVLTMNSPPFTCSGYVTMVGGSPLASATVTVKTESGSTITSDTTDSNGYYSVTVSDPDSYSGTTFQVTATKAQYKTESEWFTKTGTKSRNFELSMVLGMHIYGWITDDISGLPISSATVSIDGLGSDTTDSNGKYDIIGPSADFLVYSFDVRKTGYEDFHTLVEISSGDARKDASLSPLPPYDVHWNSPANGADITFGPGTDPFPFDFSYTYSEISDVHLFLNGVDYGSVWGSTQISLDYNSNIDGDVVATLVGYDGLGTQQATDSRTFHFTWIYSTQDETLQTGTEIMPSQLYTIIHDPAGDGSTASFEQSSTFTLSVGFELGVGVTVGYEIGAEADLFGFEIGASQSVELSLEASVGYDFEYEMTTTDSLTSSDISDDPDFIGPGYGDVYWGEGWAYAYRIIAQRIEYFNGTTEYTQPRIHYGIVRSSEMILNSLNAPSDWKALNPVLNNYEGVSFDETKTFDGGHSYDYSRSTTTTHTLSESITISYSSETKLKLGIEETSLTLEASMNVHGSQSWSNEIQNSYTLADDDPTDIITVDIGTDPTFGTLIFRVSPDSQTSNPLEHNTMDYQPPEISDPTIVFDTDQQDPSPSEGDSPLVQATITDEGGVANANVYYSTDGGNFYYHEPMTQLPDSDTWEANIPAQEHGTTVLWYIRAGDTSDQYSERKNEYNEPFSYIVENRLPTVSLITPNGGGEYARIIDITWSGSDPDGDSLLYSLGYSFDGTIWHSIASSISGTSYTWDISGISDHNSVVIKIIADDGAGGEVSDVSDFAFSINNPDTPSVNYLGPLAGVTYSNTITIEWEVEDIDGFITSFDLEYSTDNGLTWNSITTGISASFYSYDWDTTAIIYSNQVKIKVTANYEIDGVPDSTFDLSGLMTIDNRPDLTVSLISPNGGEIFQDSASISWSITTSLDVTYSSTLEYSTDGVNFATIKSSLAGTSYTWNTHDIPYGTNYRVRVTVSGTYMGIPLVDTSDISDGVFTIDPDLDAPVVSDADNHIYEFGENGNTISWTASDDNPYQYSLKRNGVFLIENADWTSSPNTFEFSLDGLAVGDYTYEFIATDIWGQTTSDTALISITDSTEPIFHFLTPANESIFEYGDSIDYSYIASDPSEYTITLELNGQIIEDLGTIEGLEPGFYILIGYATDAYDNVGMERIVFTVEDTVAPQVSISAPVDGSAFELGDDVSYSYTVSDMASTTITVLLDGVEISDTGVLSGLVVGTYVLTVSAKDASGNVGSDSISFTVSDTTAPVVEITAPLEGSIFELGDDVSYSYTVSDLASATVSVLLDGIEISDTSVLSGLAVGTYALVVSAEDTSGNVGSDSISFTVSDTTAPVVEFTAPLEGSTFELGVDVSYSYTVSDLSATTVNVLLNGIEISDTGVLSGLGLGTFVLTVSAEDAFGNMGSDSVSFSVSDDIAPVVEITLPESGFMGEYGQNIEYSYTVVDSGEYSVIVLLNGDEIQDTGLLRDLNIGDYVLRVVATDDQMNTGYDEITFSIQDTTAPEVEILSPANATSYEYGSSVSYSYEFSDLDDVVVEVYLNGIQIENTGAIEGLEPGCYFLMVQATDNSGNIGFDEIEFFIVDTTGPLVEIITPESGATYELGANVSYTYEISEDAVAVFVLLDGQEINDTGILTHLDLGTHNLTVIAEDGFGNQGSFSISIQIVDTTAPIVVISLPENGTEFSHGSNVEYEYFVSDISEYTVEIYLNSEKIEDSGILSGLADGDHLLKVVATDSSNNTGFSEVTFTILEDTEIVLTVTAPNGGEIVSDLYNVTWEIVNPESLELRYDLYYSLDNGNTWISIVNGTLEEFYYWNTSPIEGSFTNCLIKVQAHTVGSDVILAEDVSDYTFTVVNQPGGGIPGYSGLTLSVFAMLGIIFLISKKKK